MVSTQFLVLCVCLAGYLGPLSFRTSKLALSFSRLESVFFYIPAEQSICFY